MDQERYCCSYCWRVLAGGFLTTGHQGSPIIFSKCVYFPFYDGLFKNVYQFLGSLLLLRYKNFTFFCSPVQQHFPESVVFRPWPCSVGALSPDDPAVGHMQLPGWVSLNPKIKSRFCSPGSLYSHQYIYNFLSGLYGLHNLIIVHFYIVGTVLLLSLSSIYLFALLD